MKTFRLKVLEKILTNYEEKSQTHLVIMMFAEKNVFQKLLS